MSRMRPLDTYNMPEPGRVKRRRRLSPYCRKRLADLAFHACRNCALSARFGALPDDRGKLFAVNYRGWCRLEDLSLADTA